MGTVPPAPPPRAGAGGRPPPGKPPPDHGGLVRHHLHPAADAVHQRAAGTVQPRPDPAKRGVCGQPAHRAPDPRRGLVRRQKDRKSTRLNSSHVSISYAVICLKKKNTNIELMKVTTKHINIISI